MLTLILIEDRHDWSKGGAAIALLEYSKQAVTNETIAEIFEQSKTLDKLLSLAKMNTDI